MGTKTELGASVRSALKGPSLQAPFFFWFFILVSLMNFFSFHSCNYFNSYCWSSIFFCFLFCCWVSIGLYLFWSNSLIILTWKLAVFTQHYFFQYLWITKLKSYGILQKSCCFAVHAFVSTVNLHNCWLGYFLSLYLGNIKKKVLCSQVDLKFIM